MTERFYQPGEDVKNELTAEVRALAERAVAAISPTLRLVNVKEATSMVSCLRTVLHVIMGASLFQSLQLFYKITIFNIHRIYFKFYLFLILFFMLFYV